MTLPLLLALRLLQTIPLAGETYHVQGIEVDGQRLWVTSVDAATRRGFLIEYELPAGRELRRVEIQQGVRFHPGGMSGDGDSLWIPVAEYRRSSSATIQKRSKRTLALEASFEVPDHIGAIAVTPDGLLGANWDARDFYLWRRDGTLIRKQPNPGDGGYQDWKFVAGQLVAGGLAADKSGVLDWFDWPGLRRVRRVEIGRTDRGIVYTHEGMTIRGGRLYLLPEDGPSSRLFVFAVE